jgi:glycosyltransferase 2 family protein
MKNAKEFVWPIVGLAAVAVSGWLLYQELTTTSIAEIGQRLVGIPPHRYALAFLATLVAYGALAWYDRIALIHLGVRHVSWLFVSVTSFTTYALSHNIGASVFSGALVRYRAYTSKGLSGPQVAVLVALCSFTFGLGTALLLGVVLTYEPEILLSVAGRVPEVLTNPTTARVVGFVLLAGVATYIAGSLLHFRPLTIRGFTIAYPRPNVMVRQLIAAPLELLGAAGIIYFALPEAGNPGFMIVLGAFLAAFSLALASHAPGGLGVLELIFVAMMPSVDKAAVVAALLVFRLFYLILPLFAAILVVLLFERARLAKAWSERMPTTIPPVPRPPPS